MRNKSKAVKEQRWRISRIKATPAVEIGTVEAPDADVVIKKAIKEFQIPQQHYERLMARRVG